jgi:hypothetical protein
MRGRIALGLVFLVAGMQAQAQSSVCPPDDPGRTDAQLASQMDSVADVVMAGAILRVATVLQDGVERPYVFVETRRVWRGFVPQFLRFPFESCKGEYLQGVSYLLYLQRDPRAPAGEYRLPPAGMARALQVVDHEDIVEELGEPKVRWNGGRREGPELVPDQREGPVYVPAAAAVPMTPDPSGAAVGPAAPRRVVLDAECPPAAAGERGRCVEVVPGYPASAASRCLAGRVVANVNVDTGGDVLFVNVVEEDPPGEGFATRAVEALLETRFQPLEGASASGPVEVRRETVLFEPDECPDRR